MIGIVHTTVPGSPVRPDGLIRFELTMRVGPRMLHSPVKRFKGGTVETSRIATVAHLVRCVGIGTAVNCTHCRQAGKPCQSHTNPSATNPSVARGGRFTVAPY